MLGSVRRGRQLADRPRTLLGTSVVTCSTDQEDTNFVRRLCLPRVSVCDEALIVVACLTRCDRFLQVLDRILLGAEAVALLVMEPA